MQVLFITDKGELLPLADRVQRDGHRVSLRMNQKIDGRKLNGVPELPWSGPLVGAAPDRVKELLSKEKPDFVVLDSSVGVLSVPMRDVLWNQAWVWGADIWSYAASVNEDYTDRILKDAEINPFTTDVSCGAWWDGSGFLYPHLVVEELGTMNGGVGQQIPGSILVRMTGGNYPLANETFDKLSQIMRQVSYRGPVIMGKEFKAGFNLGQIAAMMELLYGDFVNIAMGKPRKPENLESVSLGVRVTAPSASLGEDFVVTDKAKRHVWLADDGESVYGWVTACGVDVHECRRRVYRTIKNLNLPELGYRTDAGVKIANIMPDFN